MFNEENCEIFMEIFASIADMSKNVPHINWFFTGFFHDSHFDALNKQPSGRCV